MYLKKNMYFAVVEWNGLKTVYYISSFLLTLVLSPEKMLTVAFEFFQKFPMQIWVLNYTYMEK